MKVNYGVRWNDSRTHTAPLTLKVLVVTIDTQWEGMGDVGSARYELALRPPCPTIRVLSYSNYCKFWKFNTLRVKNQAQHDRAAKNCHQCYKFIE